MTSSQRSIPCAPFISTSGSTIGTSRCSWQSAAYRASACALALTHATLGRLSVMRITARHLAKRAPMPWYSARRSRSPSSPSVTVSSGAPASGSAPVSTLMPGTMPWLRRTSASGVPPELFWRIVSSYRMAPLMNSAAPGVVNSISRYARRRGSVDAIPSASNRRVKVATLSSAARIPLPSATSAAATLARSPLILPLLPMCSRASSSRGQPPPNWARMASKLSIRASRIMPRPISWRIPCMKPATWSLEVRLV